MFCPGCGNPCTDLEVTDMTRCYECNLCGGHYVYFEAEDNMATYGIPMAGENCVGCGALISA